MNEIPNCFYRVSVKALVLDESRTKFLIVQEKNGDWALPGGGLDWGTTPQEDLPREIQEEMGLKVKWVAGNPSYFLSAKSKGKEIWVANIVYETELENLDFTPSYECNALKFVDANSLEGLTIFSSVRELSEKFNPKNHTPS
ncbi:NUDIX hydrolase [bacterium]|jgi:8-oxo-dGTP diphosphatase|nr:NUDIX hydrolase [bacterium]MBT3730091.1 NUDIX hydrolase [bacterium]MBT4894487.1 NUDIX hydrolase [bacterium]